MYFVVNNILFSALTARLTHLQRLNVTLQCLIVKRQCHVVSLQCLDVTLQYHDVTLQCLNVRLQHHDVTLRSHIVNSQRHDVKPQFDDVRRHCRFVTLQCHDVRLQCLNVSLIQAVKKNIRQNINVYRSNSNIHKLLDQCTKILINFLSFLIVLHKVLLCLQISLSQFAVY